MLKQSEIQGYLHGLHAVWQIHKNTSEEPTNSTLQTAVGPSKMQVTTPRSIRSQNTSSQVQSNTSSQVQSEISAYTDIKDICLVKIILRSSLQDVTKCQPLNICWH